MIVKVRLDADSLLLGMRGNLLPALRTDSAPPGAGRREALLWGAGAASFLTALFFLMRLGA